MHLLSPSSHHQIREIQIIIEQAQQTTAACVAGCGIDGDNRPDARFLTRRIIIIGGLNLYRVSPILDTVAAVRP
jgi:hypothetical protein